MVKIKKYHYERGVVSIIALIIMSSIVAVVVFSIGMTIGVQKQIGKSLLNSKISYYMAESGMEDAVYRKIKGYNLPSGTLTLDNANIDQALNTVGSITTVNSVSNYFDNIRKLTTTLMVTTTGVAFHYGVQVGEGGLTMGNGSSITGNLYSDGSVKRISGSDAVITGDVFVATGMNLDASGDWENYTNDRDFSAKNSTIIDIAMKFTPSEIGKLSQIAFYIKKNDAPPDASILIVNDNGTGLSPSTTLVEPTATAVMTASKVGTSYSWVKYSFSNPPQLNSGTDYWIVINADKSNNNDKYYSIGKSASNADISVYNNNWNTSPWTTEKTGATNYGYEYKAWIGGQETSIDSIDVGGDVHAHSIINSQICGDAYYSESEIDATSLNFVNNPSNPPCNTITLGTAHPNSPDPAVVTMPLSAGNITDWKNAAIGAGYLDPGLCTSSDDNISLDTGILDCSSNGDVFEPSSSSLVITLNGIVWIRGDIDLPMNSVIQLSSGYGATSGIIIADYDSDTSIKGKIDTGNGTLICGSQGYDSSTNECYASNGSYIMLLSTYSGTDTAIEISNNASGAIYYAYAGKANVSNNANDVKEVTAYKLSLDAGASVTYESGLASTVFSTGPGGGWIVNSWNETQ